MKIILINNSHAIYQGLSTPVGTEARQLANLAQLLVLHGHHVDLYDLNAIPTEYKRDDSFSNLRMFCGTEKHLLDKHYNVCVIKGDQFAENIVSSDYYMYSPFYQLRHGGGATGIFAAILNATKG